MNQDPPRNILVTGVFPALSTTTLPRADSFSNDVLFQLKEMPLRTCDVARVTEKTRAYVDSYLRRLRNQGLIEKHGSFWNLSVLGASYVGYLEKIEDRRSRSRHNNNTTTTNKQHKVDAHSLKKPEDWQKQGLPLIKKATYMKKPEEFVVKPDMKTILTNHIAYLDNQDEYGAAAQVLFSLHKKEILQK